GPWSNSPGGEPVGRVCGGGDAVQLSEARLAKDQIARKVDASRGTPMTFRVLFGSLLLATPILAADPPLTVPVIVADPGHVGQGSSNSCSDGTRGVASGLTESELNLKVAVELARLLKKQGAEVHMTREADHRLSREGSSNVDELPARIDFF